jgi:hypothetical protein
VKLYHRGAELVAPIQMPSAQTAEWMTLLFCPPGKTAQPVGILLIDHANRLTVKLKPKLDIDDETVLAIWEGLVQDLHEEAGGYELIRWLEMTGSHAFRVSPRQVVEAEDLAQALNGLYDQNVE